MTNRIYGLILTLAFSFTASSSYSEVYRWVDEQGKVHFGDKAHANKQAEDISARLKQQNSDESAQRTKQTLQQIDHRQQAKQTEAQQKQAQSNQKNEQRQRSCRDAKRRLRILQGPVVFYDENNQQIKVSEKQREQRAEALSQQIKHNCA